MDDSNYKNIAKSPLLCNIILLLTIGKLTPPLFDVEINVLNLHQPEESIYELLES